MFKTILSMGVLSIFFTGCFGTKLGKATYAHHVGVNSTRALLQAWVTPTETKQNALPKTLLSEFDGGKIFIAQDATPPIIEGSSIIITDVSHGFVGISKGDNSNLGFKITRGESTGNKIALALQLAELVATPEICKLKLISDEKITLALTPHNTVLISFLDCNFLSNQKILRIYLRATELK